MKFFIRLVVMMTMVCTAQFGWAAKVAVVEPMEAIGASNLGKAELEKLQTEFSKEESKGMAMQQELKGLVEKHQKDSAVMSADAVRGLKEKIEEKQMDIKFLSQKLQKRFQDSQKAIVDKLGPNFKQALKNVTEREGFDIVIQRQVVLELGNGMDITSMVVDEMNKKAAPVAVK